MINKNSAKNKGTSNEDILAFFHVLVMFIPGPRIADMLVQRRREEIDFCCIPPKILHTFLCDEGTLLGSNAPCIV